MATITHSLAADTAASHAAGTARLALRLQSTLGLGLVGGLLLWLAMPPVDWWPLAWIAPAPWAMLAMRSRSPGRRGYYALWLAGFAFWLAALHWLTLPHWTAGFGLLALAAYLAVYLPAFVGLTRVGVHRLGLPGIVVAPVVWTGLEMARAYLLSGFTMAGLAHTQYRWLSIIQISDLVGAYGVSFLVMFVAACLARMFLTQGQRITLWPLAPLSMAIATALAYGSWSMSHEPSRPGGKVALIQGSIDTEMKADPNQGQMIFEQYVGLSRRAVADEPGVELVVWPETMFRYPWFTFDPAFRPSDPQMPPPARLEASSRREVAGLATLLDKPLLIGIDGVHYTPERMERYNSALFASRAGEPLGRYDKMHLVMFGEYVPFARALPWLYSLTPLTGSADFGKAPLSAQVGGVRYAPNICYESTVPHLIAGQVRALRALGEEPDVLVNLTNDGWFWGSAELDMHLACGVLRAVECRKPFLIAANTGFSAWIESDGHVVRQGRRRDTDIIIAQPQLDGRRSWYLAVGDWPAGVCLASCVVLAAVGLFGRRRPAELAVNGTG